MKPRTTTNLDVLVIIGSVLITELMLVAAMALRERFSIWTPLDPGANLIPWVLSPLVGLIVFMAGAFGFMFAIEKTKNSAAGVPVLLAFTWMR